MHLGEVLYPTSWGVLQPRLPGKDGIDVLNRCGRLVGKPLIISWSHIIA